MADPYDDTEHQPHGEEWSGQESAAKNEEFIRSYDAVLGSHGSLVPEHEQFEAPLYHPTDDHFNEHFEYPDHGYFIPEEGSFHHQSHTMPAYKVEKRPGKRFRRAPGHPQLYIPTDAPPYSPATTTPPGSAGVPGPMSTAHYLDAKWGEEVPLRAMAQAEKPSSAGVKKRRKEHGGPVPRQKFTLEEDITILRLRHDEGLGWSVIAEAMEPRSEKGLQVHYSVSLKDRYEDWAKQWTKEEDKLLADLVAEHERPMWEALSKRFGGLSPTTLLARHRFLTRRREAEIEGVIQRHRPQNM